MTNNTTASFNTIKRPISEDTRRSSPSLSSTPTPPSFAFSSPRPSDHEHSIERNHCTLPLPMTSSKYPSIPRFAPVPNRMSGNYTPGTSAPRRSGTSSASSSPPGTPPTGLRKPAAIQRSYSADHLRVDEPEITITSSGGSNSTEHHATTLQQVLSILTEENRVEEENENENEEDGPIVMKNPETSAGSSSSQGTHRRSDTSALQAGVLSNLLKLQGIGRQHKASSSKPRKEKKQKRPVMYSRSSNNSTASLTKKSVF
ncbi:hypothetical protein BG006_001042, partial [Podila minutissima]